MKTFSILFEKDADLFKLDFNVHNNSVAEKWYSCFSKASINDLRQELEIFKFFDDCKEKYTKLRNRINELITILNTFEGIHIDGYFDDSNPNESLNRLHQHFVASADDHDREMKGHYYREYNDVIHSMEGLISVMRIKASRARILLRFNSPTICEIENDEFLLFTKTRRFGDVYANYPHAGRGPIEMFFSNDFDIPSDQIVPQHSIFPDTQIYLGDNHLDNPSILNEFDVKFKEFYTKVGVDRWKYAIDDPRLAIGYLPVASLNTALSPEVLREKLRGSTLQSIIL